VVLDHSTVIFQKEKKGGGGTYKKSLVCKTPIVKVTTFKLEGEVTSLSESSQREVVRILGEVNYD
jgi:hypothetical protein